MNDKRTPIKSISCDKKHLGISRGKIIYLRKEGTDAQSGEYFKINSVIGEGGSCICYDATLIGEKKTGRLKEFYPLESLKKDSPFLLERNERNQIIAALHTQESFLAIRREFVESYHLLRDVMEKNKNNSDFISFIPDFSIYYACDEKGNIVDGSTAYIWTAPENLTVFESYIEDVRRHPNVYPEHKLFTILKATLTLTECVKILHENGLLHLDIKPGNFGIPKRKGKLLTDSITLFDVNSIYSPRKSFVSGYGTKGFTAPEVINGKADNTSDIYSIGCTLFSALITHVENERIDFLGYSKQYYTKIPQLIDASDLMSASNTNSNIFLKYELISILKKCLAETPSRRYQSCVDLIKDLERALVYLYPAQINSKLPIGKQLVVLDKELDRKNKVNPYLAFMYHLYKHPLFEFLSDDSDTLDVLIVGFGNYGQKFLDCCLQVGQILGKKLNVRVLSNDRFETKRDRDIYLAARPAMTDFFSIDGSYCEDAYGSISFESKEFVRENSKKNKELAAEIVCEYDKLHYAFIALGDDALNKSVAQAIVAATKDVSKCSVNFAYDGEHIKGKIYGVPVYMSDDITSEELYQDIERMAFNAHLVWESGLNIDLTKSRAKFKEPYYYNASLANVISIKYKLYSFGITMDDLDEAALQYYRKVVTPSKHIKNELIALEHRRWVCEKICLGWVCNRNLKSCVDGKTSDQKTKKHIAILRSTADAPLQTANWNLARWDSADEDDLATLDDLDRMSVRLHQAYKSEADRLRKESTLLDSSMLQLKSIARKNDTVSIAFSEWYSCLLLLWNGNDNPAKEYEKLKKVLLQSLENLTSDDSLIAQALINLIDDRFEIILKSMRYTDYKKYDADLVNYIPFILTHKNDTNLVIPFSCGSNTEMFFNVAAVTVVNPLQVTYLFYANRPDDLEGFESSLQYVLSYMNEKTIVSKINFVIAYRKDEKLRKAVEKMKAELFEKKKDSRIQKVIIFEAENDFCVTERICDMMGTKIKFDAVEQNKTMLSYLLLGSGFYSKYPHYRFDINTRKFYGTVDCEFLKFIKAEQYLKVSDMFASKNSKGYLESPTAFYNDYEALWKKAYRKKEYVWKKMCVLLENYHKTEDRILSIDTDVVKDKESYIKYRFLVSSVAYEGVSKIISSMVEIGIFGKNSEVYYYTTDSCEVNIYAHNSIGDKLKFLMSDPYVLSQADSIDIFKTPHSVNISFDYLTVQNLDLREAGKLVDKIKELLQMLEKEFSFIVGYTESSEDARIISFAYSTKRIKKLLTNAGKILEIYVYHKCLKSDLFDDVATGYEISWEKTAVKSEFDIILTKGFGGLLIEAKAREDIDQEHYFKLSCLAKQFGTNCRAVLIADTVEKWFNDNSNNEMQRLRGDMLDVVTIFDSQEIDNIDVTLARLLNIDVKYLVNK